MKSKTESQQRERQDWGIVLIILLIGFLCVIVAGQRALRFSPTWKLDANMESNLDPNTDFLTDKPVGFIEPVDAAILTQPAWVRVFLTPGAKFVTGTPPPAAATDVPTEGTAVSVASTLAATNTLPVTNTTIPTSTFIWPPVPATSTRRPPNTSVPPADTPTNTSPAPLPSADLRITLGSSAAWYAPGTAFTYTIVVSNTVPGSSAVTGVTVTDSFPAQVSLAGTTWSCASVGGATCTLNGTGNLSDVVNLPFNSSVTYTVNVMFNAGASGPLANSASVSGAGYTELNGGDNTSTPLTTSPGIDLRIVKIPGAGSYGIGGPVSYTIDVTNDSPFTVNGVTVTDIFSGQIDPSSLSWNCPLCPSGGSGNINDTINMAPGATVTYGVNGNARPEARGPLPNTARVTAPGGFVETNPGNETSPTSINGPSEGNINIGGPGGGVTTLPDGGAPLVMVIPPIVANGDVGTYDFVFYEMQGTGPLIPPATNPRVDLDWVQIEISLDGTPGSWRTVFYWGDGASDTNTNVAIPVNGPPPPGPPVTFCAAEDDNCQIPLARLYNNDTGIAIDIDPIVPAGNYSWIRITSPASPGGDGSDVDAIQILP